MIVLPKIRGVLSYNIITQKNDVTKYIPTHPRDAPSSRSVVQTLTHFEQGFGTVRWGEIRDLQDRSNVECQLCDDCSKNPCASVLGFGYGQSPFPIFRNASPFHHTCDNSTLIPNRSAECRTQIGHVPESNKRPKA